MKTSLLEMLACPVCQKSLEFEGDTSGDRLTKGVFRCLSGHLYQMKDEIPILKDPKLSKKEFVWKVEFPDIEKYDEIRKKYASHLSEEQKEADRALRDKIVKIVLKERLLLDVASGMGTLLLDLSQQHEKGKNVLGADVDEKPLRGAKLKLEEQRSYSQVSLFVMDIKHLALKPRLSCITSYFGLDNIPETKKAIQEVSRVLTSKGKLILATLWLKEGSRSLTLAEKLGYGAIATENRLTRTLEETGFEIDSAEKFYSGEWPYNPMDRLPLEGDWYAHALVLAHKR
jgi:ubiquinone/menaquinone biosynthesis C-methylase UbiE/uncharacterized protein YbaR (Trm112 family)